MLSNLLLFFYDNDLTCSRIGISKINAQLTLFRYSHARSAEICLAGNTALTIASNSISSTFNS